jgi:DNA-binding transcriptional ArsR family regulator
MVEQSTYLDNVFRALADPTRRAMIHRLSAGARTVTELAEPFDMSLAAASKHIKVLERASLIERTIDGRTHTCRLNAGALAEANRWIEYYERFWNDRLDALEAELRRSTEPDSEPTDEP